MTFPVSITNWAWRTRPLNSGGKMVMEIAVSEPSTSRRAVTPTKSLGLMPSRFDGFPLNDRGVAGHGDSHLAAEARGDGDGSRAYRGDGTLSLAGRPRRREYHRREQERDDRSDQRPVLPYPCTRDPYPAHLLHSERTTPSITER